MLATILDTQYSDYEHQ